MKRTEREVRDLRGNAIEGASIIVHVANDGAFDNPAALFSDSNGTIPLTQPLTSDAKGEYFFYVADGKYDIRATFGVHTDDSLDMLISEAASGGAVSSVNSLTGAVVLDTDVINEGATNKYATDANIAASPAVTANTAKVSYPPADSAKLAGIETGATGDQTGTEIVGAIDTELGGAGWQSGGGGGAVDSVNTQTGAVVLDSDDISEGATNQYYTEARVDANASVVANTAKVSYPPADSSKLAGIEANATADQTDGEIKTAYENNADTNAFDDAAVSKLGAIEAGATTDQTGPEIKAAYEAQADTNAFTDAEQTKLTNLPTSSADVFFQTSAPADTKGTWWNTTSATNWIENTYLDDAWEATGDTFDPTTNTYTPAGSGGGGGVNSVNGDSGPIVTLDTGDIAEGANLYYTEARVNANAAVTANTAKVTYPPADSAKLAGVETGATADQTDAEIKTAYENNADTNAFTDAEQTKLTGIEVSATGDQTGAEIKAAYEGEANTNAFTDAEQTQLAAITGTNTGNEVQATESVSGIAEIATQAEADALSDDTRIITAAKLANIPGVVSPDAGNSFVQAGAPTGTEGDTWWNTTTATNWIENTFLDGQWEPTGDVFDSTTNTYTPAGAGGGSTNLSVGTVTGGTLDVNSDTGTDATLPSATVTDAGVMPASDKVKSNFISVTQAVDLDQMETDVEASKTKTDLLNVVALTDIDALEARSVQNETDIAGLLIPTNASQVQAVTRDFPTLTNVAQAYTAPGVAGQPNEAYVDGRTYFAFGNTPNDGTAMTFGLGAQPAEPVVMAESESIPPANTIREKILTAFTYDVNGGGGNERFLLQVLESDGVPTVFPDSLVTTGTGSAYVQAVIPGQGSPGVLQDGRIYSILPHIDSIAGAVTVNYNGLGAIAVTLPNNGGNMPVGGFLNRFPAYLRYVASGPRFEALVSPA